MFLKQCDCHCEILLRERVEKFSQLLFAEICELFAPVAGFPLVFANLWYLTESGLGRPRGPGVQLHSRRIAIKGQ